MIVAHCRYYISFYFPNGSLPLSNFKGLSIYWYLLGSLTLCFPSIAGANFYLRISSLLDYDQLDRKWLQGLLSQASFLLLIDPLKNFFTSGFYTLIRWDILIFLFCSMAYLGYLKLYLKKSLSILLFTFSLCIFFHVTKSYIINIAFLNGDSLSFFKESGYSILFMVISMSIFSAFLLSFIFRVKLSILRPFIFFFTVLFIVKYIEYWTSNPRFAASMTNMPLAAFYNIELIGGHIWSFFPWILLPVLGFIWFEIIVSRKRNKQLVSGFFLLYFLYFLYFLFPDYVNLQDPHRVHGGGIYTTDILTIVGFFSFFVVVYQLIDTFKDYIPNVNIAGSSIIFFYFTHHVVSYWSAAYMRRLFVLPTQTFLAHILFTIIVTLGLTLIIGHIYQSRVVLISRKL